MSMAQMFLNEFEQEVKTTRRFLEQLPADKLNWKPHAKSQSAGQLALHIASVPGGIAKMAIENEAPLPDFKAGFPQPSNVAEVLSALDASAAAVRQILPKFSDEQMQQTWRATGEGREILAIPRAAFLRSIMLNHWYHHRGQFGVYLRLMGAKVPSSYGPSGDEAPDFARGD